MEVAFFWLVVEVTGCLVAIWLEVAVLEAVDLPEVVVGAVFFFAVVLGVAVLGLVLGAGVGSVAAKAAQPTGRAIAKIAARVRKDPV